MAGLGREYIKRLVVRESVSLGYSPTLSKVGVFGATPIVRPAAYTQTYSTAGRTHPAMTSAATATTASTTTTPFGYTTQAQADAIITNLNALRTDVINNKNLLNQVIDDLQAFGWLA